MKAMSSAALGLFLVAGAAFGACPEGWLRAWSGQEPQASVREETGWLLPTAAEVRRLPALVRTQRQTALKRVFLERARRAREERHRVTEANLSACAALAARLGAPEESVESLRELAEGDLSSRRRHVLNKALEALAEAYAVDALAIRYFVEASGLDAAEVQETLSWLPLEALFNLTPAETPSAARRLSDRQLERQMALELERTLRRVHDRESADAAAEALRPLLLLRETQMATLLHEAEGEDASPRVQGAGQELYQPWERSVNRRIEEERARLKEAVFFGSSRLRGVDYLLHS